MSTKSRENIYGASARAAAEKAAEARKAADRLACEAWNKRMLGFQGPAQPSPALGDAINAGFVYLEVKCLGCNTHQTVALNIVRRPKPTPIHELERYMRCKDCSRLQGRPYKRTSGGAATNEDFRPRSCVNMVAGRARLRHVLIQSPPTKRSDPAAIAPHEPLRHLPAMQGVFPDYPAPVIRNAVTERELNQMRWGMPPPPRTGGPPVTNIRTTSSPH